MPDPPAGHHPGAVVRAARLAAGWRQSELGRRCGWSASQISRWETGASPLRDVAVLRVLAAALDLDPRALGVTLDTSGGPSHASRGPRPTVGALPTEEDAVRRREFLLAAGLLATGRPVLPAPGAAPVDPAHVLNQALVNVVLGPVAAAEPVPIAQLRSALGTARAQFTACRYLPLADALPALITAAEATTAATPTPPASTCWPRPTS